MSNLPEKMKAIVAYAPGDYRLETVDTPHAGEGEMILKVEACGICAGDGIWRRGQLLGSGRPAQIHQGAHDSRP